MPITFQLTFFTPLPIVHFIHIKCSRAHVNLGYNSMLMCAFCWRETFIA